MTTFQRVAIAGSTVGLSLSLAFAAAAARAPDHGFLTINVRGKTELKGVVTKIDLAAKTIGVKVWGVEWTVKVTDETKLAPKGRGGLTLVDVQVDHVVHVGGTVDAAVPLTVTAKRIVDQSVRVRKAEYTGSISALAPPDAFTLQVERGGQLTVKVTAETVIEDDNVRTAFADLTVGTSVKVKGTYDAATNTLTAKEVEIRDADDDDEDRERGFDRSEFRGRGPRDR